MIEGSPSAIDAPSSAGLARMAKDIGASQADISETRRLLGGSQAVTHAMHFEGFGSVVLKRFLRASRRLPTEELMQLRAAATTGVPAPSPVEADDEGRWFGCPALVMTLLDGEMVQHWDRGPWITRAAEALARVHGSSVSAARFPVLNEPHAALRWQPLPPDRFPRTPRVQRLLRAVESLQRDFDTNACALVLLHHDFRQNNLLWHDGQISGLVDWHDARVGPPVSDVAYFTVDLVRTHTVRAAEEFVAAYAAIRGELEDLARWQALWLASQLPWMRGWATIRHPEGGRDLTRELVTRRLRTFADDIVTRL